MLELLCLKGFLDRSDIPAYKKLGNLRNNVAHKLRYSINTKVAVALWDALSKKQRTQIEQKFNVNRQTTEQNPDMLVKAVTLRLYTHVQGIIEREDARLEVATLFMKSFKGN